MRQLAAAQARQRSPFPPIADYGFLSDCETCALVAPSGNVEWLCLPRLDSPSVFGAILDRDAGGFRLGPADAEVPAARRYVPGTLVLETTWETRTGWIIVRDALCIRPPPAPPPGARSSWRRPGSPAPVGSSCAPRSAPAPGPTPRGPRGPTAAPPRTTTPSTSSCAPSNACRARRCCGSTASRRSTT